MTTLAQLAKDFTRAPATDSAARNEVGLKLMIEFTDRLGDVQAMAELQSRYPAIVALITGIPKDARAAALKASQDGRPLDAYAPHVADFISAYDKENEGTRPEVGFTLRHKRLGEELVGDDSWTLMPDLRVGRAKEPRLVLPDDTWAEVFPGWQGWGVRDDVEDRMRMLGVPRRKVDAKSQRIGGKDTVHVPGRDGVLFLDDLCLRKKAKRMLEDNDVPFVRRMKIDGTERDMFALPADLFLAMRGVSYQLPSRTSQAILERCRERLSEREIESPDLHLVRIDGKDHICMPPDEALTLLAPAHPGDAAAKLTLERFDFDAATADYDPEIGVLLMQASMLSYEPDDTIHTHANAWGFSEVETFAETAGNIDAQAFAGYDPDRDTVMISFRGSESNEDFRADADFSSVDGSQYGGGKVQEGFEVQLRALIPKLEDFLKKHPDAKVMLTGHSLGGAMAALFYGWCLEHGIHVDQTYTCGQPPVGDDEWREGVERLAAEARTKKNRPVNLFRYVYGSDPVPHAPKFEHTGTMLYIDDDGKLQDPATVDLPSGFFNLLGRVWDSIDNSFLHHRCPSYLGIVRKNREVCFKTLGI